jgi:hypothetical protein
MENKKPKIDKKRFVKLNDKNRHTGLPPLSLNVAIAFAVLGVGYVIYKKIKDRENRLLQETKNKMFEIITDNCSSSGVNKMQIVDQIGLIIEAERKATKTKIAKLEAQLEEVKDLINKNA